VNDFAAALSEHPVASHAVGEAVGQVLETVGPAPDLAVLVVSAGHVGALDDVAGVVREVLQPTTLLGAAAGMVLGGTREVEGDPAIAIWAGRTGEVTPFHVPPAAGPDAGPDAGLLATSAGPDDVVLLVADPFSFHAEQVLADVAASAPGARVVGGLASAARGPGGSRLVLDTAIHTGGAVGVILSAAQVGATVVSQGCRPVGEPMVVTRAERSVVYELAGRPALERLMETADALPPDDRDLLARGVQVGIVIDEHRSTFDRGDFLIRNVLGADRSVGAIAVGDEVEVGATVQFQVRDGSTAEDDLRALLAPHEARASLVFTCNGRGTHLFGLPDRDATIVQESLDRPATLGMSCAGELGPVGGRNHLHGFTASVLTFR
jgi:small ligand-binding sensory domain FIST